MPRKPKFVRLEENSPEEESSSSAVKGAEARHEPKVDVSPIMEEETTTAENTSSGEDAAVAVSDARPVAMPAGSSSTKKSMMKNYAPGERTLSIKKGRGKERGSDTPSPVDPPSSSGNFRQPPEGKPLGFLPNMWFLLGGALLALALVWGIYALANTSRGGETTPTPTPSAVNPTVKTALQEEVPHGATGNSVEEDQKAALEAARLLLEEAGKSPDGKDDAARLLALDEDDFSVVTPALQEKVRWPALAEAPMKAEGYQALIALHSLLQRGGQEGIQVLQEEAASSVFVDSQLGMAYVPVKAFVGKSTFFSLEMVYVEGEWRLAPYSLLESVRLSAIVGAAGVSGLPTATPSK